MHCHALKRMAAQRMAIGGRCMSRSSAPAHATDLCFYSTAEVWDYGTLMRERTVVVQKGVRAILGLPLDSHDALAGDWTNGLARSSMRRKFAGMTNVHAAEGWIKCSGLQLHWAEVRAARWELIGRRVCRRLSTGPDRAEHR
jgi:hypothetical protein